MTISLIFFIKIIPYFGINLHIKLVDELNIKIYLAAGCFFYFPAIKRIYSGLAFITLI